MQILKKTELEAFEKVKGMKSQEVIDLINEKGLTGRGGASFPTGKKWQFALNTEADEKYVICNADEGEPGTFKDKFILKNNPETMIEGMLIAAHAIGVKHAYIYLRGEYEYLKDQLEGSVKKVLEGTGADLKIDIIIGAGAYVCGDETAIIESIQGNRGHPYYKPPFPPSEGLWGKPTIINNVETLTNVAQAVLFDDWNKDLRLMSVSGNLKKPGLHEMPVGSKVDEFIEMCEPEDEIKAVYFGCFGGCMPYSSLRLTPENVCGKNCVVGSYTIVAVDKNQSIIDVARSIADFYNHESCGKCTPCRKGSRRILELIEKFRTGKPTKDDLETLQDLAEHIHDTSLCGLGQTATNHVIEALQYFRHEFEEKIR